VIIKPSEMTPLTTLLFAEIFEHLPPGVVNIVTGYGATVGRELVVSPHTQMIAFTGSFTTGREIARLAAERVKRTHLELGGKAAFIVAEDADLDVAVPGVAWAALLNAGQVCTSAERFFVVGDVHDAFVQAFKAETLRLRVGNGLDRAEIGPLVSKAARAKVIRLVEDAKAKGATVICGGKIPDEQPIGWFYEPTILTGVTMDMAIMQEECFGPVAPIVKVRDFEEAIERANDSPFGLGASIFTTSLEEAMEAAERLESGMVWVNNPMIDNDALPFGGWKSSGMGRELSRLGLDAFRRSKMVIIDHKPVRQGWWYPYPDDWFYETGGRKHV